MYKQKMGARFAARFLQLETTLAAFMDLQIGSELPIIRWGPPPVPTRDAMHYVPGRPLLITLISWASKSPCNRCESVRSVVGFVLSGLSSSTA